MFLNYTDLIQRTIRRIRQVPGAGAQLYSEDEIGALLREVYMRVRSKLYWEHLMRWCELQLDGVGGLVTTPFTTYGRASQHGDDVQAVFYGASQRPLPMLGSINPSRVLGTVPKYIKKLSVIDDPSASYLFRVFPVTAKTSPSRPIVVYVRLDPIDLFNNPNTIVPFDSSVLINGAAAEYLSFDGQLARGALTAYEARLDELIRAQNSAPIILDSRMYGPDRWLEIDN